MSALPAPHPGKAMGKDSAFQVTTELPLHVGRHRPGVVVTVTALGEPGREVLLDAAIENTLAWAARRVPPKCAFPGPARAVHACPLVERGSRSDPKNGSRWRSNLARQLYAVRPGILDDETGRLEPGDNPFEAKVLPMSPV